jgi:hypothetical protein
MTLSLRPLLDNLTIKTTSLQLRKFDLDFIDPDPTIGDWGWAQRPYIREIERQYNGGRPVRIIVLKARQLGISTATEAVLFLWAFLHPGTNGLVVSHQDGQAQELYEMTRTYWDTWPHKALFDERYKTRRQLRWTDTGSQIRVATAKNPEGLRGSTIHALHGSEVAFWPDAETLWTGLNNTIPRRHGTIAVLESTANGVGNWFHEKWQEAESGESEFVPMFFPWYKHSAYRLSNYLHHADLDAEERDLLRMMTAENMSEDEAMASIAWRRVEIPRQGGIEKFHQEFPSTAHEAFVVSGNPIFNPSRVEECYEPKHGAVGRLYRDGRGTVGFEDDPSGDLRLFKKPSLDVRSDKYFVSADPSENRHAGDPACIQVINRLTNEQVAVWHSHANPVVVARQMMLLGDFYHQAMLCPEAEGGGQATIGAIMQAGYPNVWSWKKPDRTTASFNVWGWSTNYNTKIWAITELQNLFNTHSILIHDKLTYNELLNYVEHANGTLGNSSNSPHDDTVMALAIAVCASKREGHFKPATPQGIPLDIFSSEFELPPDDMASIIPIRKIREGIR